MLPCMSGEPGSIHYPYSADHGREPCSVLAEYFHSFELSSR